MAKLETINRGQGYTTLAVVPYRKVEPIVEIVDRPDYREEEIVYTSVVLQRSGSTYDMNGRVSYVRKRPGTRLSIRC